MQELIELEKKRQEAKDGLDMCKKALAEIEAAIEETTRPLIQREQDTGTVNTTIGNITIKHTVPKKVDWEQSILTGLAEKIIFAGDNPLNYMERTWKVSEKKFSAFPPAVQAAFLPARTVTPGKPKIEIVVEG